MPTGPGVIPPSNPPPAFPDDYANLSAINGNNVITTDEDSVTVSGISDGVGASIVTYLVPYENGEGRPGAGSSIISESNTVTVTDLGSKDANGNEIGTYSATLPTTGIAPGIYVVESYLEFPNGGNTVYEDSGAGDTQIVSIKPPSTQTLPAQIELSGTNAEITTNGQFLVYTAINEYNEPEITGHVYERNLQTGAEVDLTATGQSPTGVFAVNHTASSVGDYPTFTSANGAETFSTIEDFDLNPDGGGYNPLPVVTNAQGDQSVIGGIGANKFDVGAATAVSDDGSVVLSTETNEVQYGATGASYLEMADPQIYVTFLGTQTSSGPDVFSDIVQATSGPLAGEYLWSNAANWSEGVPASGASATLSPAYLEIDDIATLSLASLDTGKVGADIAGSLLTVDTVTIGSDAAFQADSEKTGGAVTVIIGTVSGSNAFFEANGANTSLEITDTVTQAEEYWATDGGRVILASLPSDSGFQYRDGIGTLALVAPGATIAGSVEGIAPGDVLELPGTVSHIDFGDTLDSVTTMSVTTSSGIYVFTEAGIDGVKGYTAGLDASTGLEAITFTSTPTAPSGPDVFSDSVAASSGQFLWSNAGNWSQGIPGSNGVASLAGSGIDDLAALSLSTLISNGKVTSVDGAVLSVSTLVADSASGLVANSAISGGSATVSVLLGTVTGSGGLFVADGAHASIEILSADLPGEIYQAESGGRIILDALSSGSKFGFVGAGTLALALPGSLTSGQIDAINAGDVLELPGTAVSSVTFGAHSLDIVTNTGTYDFTNVTFGSDSLEYSASVDSATGLEAITFTPTPQDVFQAKNLFGGGAAPQPFTADYFWSDTGNWVSGSVPQNGDDVTANAFNEVDDTNLSLSTLNLGAGAEVKVTGDLTVGALDGGGFLIAQGNYNYTEGVFPATITVDSIIASQDEAFVGADGIGGVAIINATLNSSSFLWADGGGFLELTTAPDAGQLSYFDPLYSDYFGGAGTIALTHPGAVNAAELRYVRPGDVLELPGTAVSSLHFGTASLTIATNAGDYVFSDFETLQPVDSYTSAIDPKTGLVAITFTGPTNPGVDVFSSNYDQGAPELEGEFWTTDGNWSALVPRDGAAVELEYDTGTVSVDNIDNLSLSSMAVDSSFQLLVAATLEAGALNIAAGGDVDAQSPFTITGNVVNNGELRSDDIIVIGGSVTGSGNIDIAGEVFIHGSVAASQALSFVGGKLALFNPGATIGAAIKNLAPGDVLELPGSTVASVIFGAHSLDIVTNSGTYDFTNVTFGSGSLEYSASVDSATGLEAITFATAPQDVFQAKNLFGGGAAPEPFTADYFWSDAGNWVSGSVPQNGDDVTANAFNEVDDTNLSLSTLNLGAGAEVKVTGDLTVGALEGPGFLIAQGNYNYTEGVFPATITVDSIIASQDGAFVGADGIGGVAIINATLNSSSFLWADGGGFLELTTAPDAGQLSYFDPLYSDYFGGAGTIALTHPGAVNAAELRYVRPGDVLELPGTAVSSLHFGTASLTIATNAGDYVFSDFETLQPVDSYTSAIDPKTGLVAITFTGPTNPGVDVFSSNYDQGAPELEGEFWTTDGNWSALVPRDGAAVELEYDTGTVSVDNIDNLSLSSMAVDSSFQLLVAATLEAGALNIAAGGDVDAQSPFTIQGDVVNAGELRSDDLITIGGSVTGSGNIDIAGEVFIHGSVAASQALSFVGGKLALFNPGATIGAAIKNLAPGDVLELPGTAVLGIEFETGAMQVTTSSGIYDFTNVSDSSPVFGDTASYDAATGLEAITFSDVDIFSDHIATGGTYLWSSAGNWSAGVPTAGASVSIASASTDDIASLSLNDLSVTASELTVTNELSVGALYVAAGAEIDDLGNFTATGDVTNDGIIATDPSVLTFDKALTGSGTIEIGADSDVIFASSVAASETVKFLSNTGTLTIDDPAGFAANVIGSGVTIVNGGTVGAPADAKPSLSSDGGSLTAGSAADEFTLNLGSVTQGGAALSAVLDLSNGAAAPADPLGSSFSISGTSFGNTGFTTLEGIAAGATVIAGTISLQTSTAGTFSETIVLSPVETESNGTTVALAKETVNVTGIVTPTTGSAQGDVHLVTFDGLHYDFQATGDFVLARSTLPGDSFQVQMQAVQYQQIAGTSVAHEYAAQLGNDRIAFTAGANGAIDVTVDGVADTAISHAGARQIFSGGTLVATAANKFVLEWNTGEQLAVSAEIPLGQTYLDANISLPSKDGPGSVQGLMGSDSGQANDFALADGTVLKNPSASELLGQFADSWRVTSETSILGDVAPVTANSLTSPLSAMSFEPAATPPAAATGKILTGDAASTQLGQALPWAAFTGDGAVPSSDTIPKPVSQDATGVADLSGGAYGGLTSVLEPASAKPNALHAANDAHGGTFRLGA
jgi:cytoskeletal protein CcmA (bactofilin family)